MRRNARFLGALLALVLAVVLAFALMPRTDDTHVLKVPAMPQN